MRLHDGLGACEWPRWYPLMMHTLKNVFTELAIPMERQQATCSNVLFLKSCCNWRSCVFQCILSWKGEFDKNKIEVVFWTDCNSQFKVCLYILHTYLNEGNKTVPAVNSELWWRNIFAEGCALCTSRPRTLKLLRGLTSRLRGPRRPFLKQHLRWAVL